MNGIPKHGCWILLEVINGNSLRSTLWIFFVQDLCESKVFMYDFQSVYKCLIETDKLSIFFVVLTRRPAHLAY